jgi:benzoyl-CoA reductase/2-hydroxyglutaryl-CoA dehydratase subunit BcrC/BadD/HgdB
MAEERKGPPLKCWPLLKETNNAYNANINQAIDEGKPVVFTTGSLPLQLVEGFDAVPIAGEWYGSICGHFRDTDLLEAAETSGFSQDLCSYARMTLGSMIRDKSFLGKYPRPTAVIGMEGTCNIQAKWFEILARYNNVPYFPIDTPFMDINDYPNWGEAALRDCVDYFVKQLRNYIDFMEWALKQKLDEEKMIAACTNKHRSELLWDVVMQLWRRAPSPITIRNLFTFENLESCRGRAGGSDRRDTRAY